MNDLIRRSDAIKALYKYNFVTKEVIEREIMSIPSADRPRGEWIRTGRTNIYGGIEVQCSNCGDKVMVQNIDDELFCRHCGADMGMKGADDE
jgi:DNA-directed RNA polymerase subunit RPC12/RpoP